MTLQRIFRDVFDDESLAITPATSPDDVDGWDSVAQVKLVLSVESEFDFRFTTEEVTSIKNVGDFLSAIRKHTDEKG